VWRFAFFVLAIIALGAALGQVITFLLATALGARRGSPGGWLAVAVLLLLALLGTVYSLRRLGRFAAPVRELVEATRRIEQSDYSARVREHGPREVRAVARAFNAMSARLEANEALRRSILADVAHELRTPLSVIRGQAEGIIDGVYPGDVAHVATILDAAQTVERLVDDLRTLALSEAGSLTLAYEPVDLDVLINETVGGQQPAAQAAGIALATHVADDLPLVSADPARLRSVVSNLLANAIRHTLAGGSVDVLASRADDEIVITVRDTGEGIPSDLLPRIFDRFVKGPTSSGSGLGLAIARDLVTAHGGTIAVESTFGEGAKVRFTLPIRD
jgi:two-component system sensor histidine kinase BaeS